MASRGGRVGVWPLFVAWALGATAYIAKAIFTASTTPLILDTDDAMRLNEVHDFLAGQRWYDLVQHRLNTPYGAELHWSRLVDVPEAALILFLRPFAGAMADTVAAYTWPLALLAVLLWLSAKLALRLGRHEALWAALLLPIVSLITIGEFAPGRFDHHSAQILCSLAILYCTIAALERPRFALGAGIFAAVALTIGIEGLPIVAATVLVFGLMWVTDRQHAAAMRDFGLSFAVTMALGESMGRLEAHRRVEARCRDAIAQQRHLLDVLREDSEITRILSAQALERLTDPQHYLGAADTFVSRVLALADAAAPPSQTGRTSQ